MNRRTNPAMVGLFVVMALAIAVTAIIVLGTHRLGRPVTPAVLYFKDSVAGLDPGAPVEWSGVSIGQVEDIRMVYDANRNDLRIPVRVALERDRIAGLGSQCGRANGLEHSGGRAVIGIVATQRNVVFALEGRIGRFGYRRAGKYGKNKEQGCAHDGVLRCCILRF